VVAGLAYFDDAESDPQPSMLVSTSWDDVKDQLRDRVRRFAHG
jgi:3-phenylpropionate/cinnamic acid dioxygenase small subunit